MKNTTCHESLPVLPRGAWPLTGGSTLGGLPSVPPGLDNRGRVPNDLIGGRAPGGDTPTLSTPFPLLAPLPTIGSCDHK